jgi:CRISPR-associated protein Csh1
MLKQALEIFKEQYDRDGEALILDAYIPPNGTYLVVERVPSGFTRREPVEIEMDKKNRTIERTSTELPFLCMADYHSSLVSMNKAIKSKVIHSNNYYAFFVKKASLRPEPGQAAAKLTEAVVRDYYETLRNPMQKYGKPESARICRKVEEQLGPPDSGRIDEIEDWILAHLEELSEKYAGKDYLKIFFRYGSEQDQWERDYRSEGERYLLPNIYNSNDSNISIKGRIYGLPDNNMGLNAKKPYLENKTRKTAAPYLISDEDVLLQKKFFDYLTNCAAAGKSNIYIDQEHGIRALAYDEALPAVDESFSGIYLRIKKGMEVEIHDADILPAYDQRLNPPLRFENLLGIETEELKREYGEVRTLWDLQALINEVLFEKTLISNYFTEPKDISIRNRTLYRNLLLARNGLFGWFGKGRRDRIQGMLDRVSLSLVQDAIQSDYRFVAINRFNLRMAIKQYFEGGKGMADQIYPIYQALRAKIAQKEYSQIDEDREYFYAVGQITSFFLSRNKGKKKPLSMGNPIINAKRDEVIKRRLRALFFKYNYDVEQNAMRCKNLYAMVLKYVPEGSVDSDMIIAGYLDRNMIYEKSEKGDKEEA